jgi:hypothetical protein
MRESVFPLEKSQTTDNIERAAVKHVINLQVGMMIAVVLWLFLAVGASLLAGPHSDTTYVVTLTRVRGAVDVLRAGSSTWQPVEADTQIEAGGRVRTGPDAAVQLTFFEGSTTDLTSNTEVSIDQMSSLKKDVGRVIILQQWTGRTYHRVQPLLDVGSRFEVETPSAVASVRGTEFALDVEADGVTRVVVVEGLVNVEAQEIVIPVEAGHETVARPQHPPEPARPASKLPAQVETLNEPVSIQAPEPTKTTEPAEVVEPASTPELSRPNPSKEPQSIREPESTEVPRSTEAPEPTRVPKPTEVPQPIEEPEPVEKPKPTKKPKDPKPTKKPKK